MKWFLIIASALTAIAAAAVFTLVPARLDASMNPVLPNTLAVRAAAQQLHSRLLIADLHADPLLWPRDLNQRNNRGHIDFPRLREGNLGLTVLASVTRSPRGLNYEHNASDAPDDITPLAIVSRWPLRSWNDLTERALFHAAKLESFIAAADGDVLLLRSQADLQAWLAQRATGERSTAVLLATEGSHALGGKLAAIDTLFAAGYRMMSLQHFFDNELGGSLHGSSGEGLSEFGRQAVARMREKHILIDVSHSSEAVVRDVLALDDKPLIVSHTGFKGHCDTPRNISDALMQEIAQRGGIIGVGFWDEAVCGTSPADIAGAIAYGIALVGEDHVALGSDFDGAVSTGFDSSQLAMLTQALLDRGLTEQTIAKVMGGNVLRFLAGELPE